MSQSSPTPPNRKLKITILTVGCRGNVQPYCALGIGLKRAGHEVTVAANENFESFVRQFDLEFAPIAGNIQEFLQSTKGQRLIAGEKLRLEDEEKLLRQQMQSAWIACQGTEVIIYTPLTNWGYHIAERLGVPCFMASVVPLTPTGMFPFLRFARTTENLLKKVINYSSYFIAEFLYWHRYRKLLNSFRTETLKLPPLPFLGSRFRRKTSANVSRIPVLYGFSSHIIPRPTDWPAWVDVTGFWFIHRADEYEPPMELEDFLGKKVPQKLTQLGVSPAPIAYKEVSEKTLAAAIEAVLGDEAMLQKAQELGEKIRGEDGVANAVEAFHRHLGLIG